ncbi:MAG: hypothetical protein MZV64_31455 [Ignavibacteriales bacterium]|nr:hypothetical protein [Ignavibacteriales bacterium]
MQCRGSVAEQQVVREHQQRAPRDPGLLHARRERVPGHDPHRRTRSTMMVFPTPPAADSYIGVKFLGTAPFPRGIDSVGHLRLRTYYNAWRFSSSSGDADYFSPQDDAENILGSRSRYERLAASLPQNKIDPLRIQPDNMTTMLDGSVRDPAPGRFIARDIWCHLRAEGRHSCCASGHAGPA